ncbi:oligosaccharide flippase family protein, partial [Paenibacillus sp. IB182496]
MRKKKSTSVPSVGRSARRAQVEEEDNTTDKSAWLRGALVLGAAAMVCKLLGTLQKIPLQNIAGDRVFGLYHAVYPLYQLVLFMTTAGLPVAVSILVAEQAAFGIAAQRRAATLGMLLLGVAGVAGCALLWIGADAAARLLGGADAAWAVRMAALALLFAPPMAALRGYFQGRQQMLPSALSQIAEQTVRVALLLALVLAGTAAGWSDAQLAAGAMAGSAAGAAAGGALIGLLWLRADRAGAVVAAGDG